MSSINFSRMTAKEVIQEEVTGQVSGRQGGLGNVGRPGAHVSQAVANIPTSYLYNPHSISGCKQVDHPQFTCEDTGAQKA